MNNIYNKNINNNKRQLDKSSSCAQKENKT